MTTTGEPHGSREGPVDVVDSVARPTVPDPDQLGAESAGRHGDVVDSARTAGRSDDRPVSGDALPDPESAAPVVVRQRRFDAAHAWTTSAVAVVALVFSLVNFVQTNTAPSVSVALPNEIRIVQGGDPSLQVYLQPNLVISRKSDRTALVRTFRLTLHRADGGVPDPYIYWNEFGQFNWISNTQGFNYQYVGDPAPVVVNQDKPQLPLLTLDSDHYLLTPGRWLGNLVAYQSDGSEINRSFCVDLTSSDVDWLRVHAGNQWRAFRNDLSANNGPDACYVAGPVSQ
jgi:hypothetical protein